MTLSKLIQKVGDKFIEIQSLNESLLYSRVRKKDGTITFATTKEKVQQTKEFVGLVIWLPAGRVPKRFTLFAGSSNKTDEPTLFNLDDCLEENEAPAD